MQFADWLLTPQRAAIHLPTNTAVIADVHLGYNEARRRGGDAIPFGPSTDMLAPLRAIQRKYGATRLIIAGDLFERPTCIGSSASWLDQLREANWELVGVVPGNHDGGAKAMVDGVPFFPDGMQLREWRIVHGDGRLPTGKSVFGHFHPCLRLAGVRAPCFLATADRLVLPAFSPDAAGVSVVGDPHWAKFQCFAIANKTVVDGGRVGQIWRPQRLAAVR